MLCITMLNKQNMAFNYPFYICFIVLLQLMTLYWIYLSSSMLIINSSYFLLSESGMEYSDETVYKCSSFWDIKFRKHTHIACFSTLYCWIKYENMGRMCICSCIARLDRFIEHKKRKDDTKAKALTQKKRWWSTSFCMLFFFVNASCLPFLLEQQR